MPCTRCNSQRIAQLTAKCSDLCSIGIEGTTKEHDGYVPKDMNIGGGDYVCLNYCLECGQIQGKFPLPTTELEENEDLDDGDDEACGDDCECEECEYNESHHADCQCDECFRREINR
jgi:hypothetical protein